MTQPVHISYTTYARLTYKSVSYALCDSDADPVRDGVRHDPVLRSDVALSERFVRGALRGAQRLQLQIGDAPGGPWRTLFGNDDIEGTDVAIELVSVVTWDNGSSSTQSYQQTLTVQDVSWSATGITVDLADIEDQRLNALYPSDLWDTTDWPHVWAEDAGRPIPRAIGTALKLPAALLLSDPVNSEWWYGLCEAPSVEVAIAAVSTVGKTFSVAADYTDIISAGSVIWVQGSTGNDNRYTVTSAVYSAPNTVITVSQPVSNGTADGSVLIFPTVLAVYRDGRLVPSSEYEVHLLDEATAQWAQPEFSATGSEWTLINNGTGTASITGGKLQLTGDGGSVNYGACIALTAIARPLRNSWFPCRVKVDAGTLAYGGFQFTHQVGTGEHWLLVQQVLSTTQRVLLGNLNTGDATTTQVDYCRAQVGTGRWLLLRFAQEQVGFNGQQHRIEVDVRGVDSRNAVAEIERLLTAAGVTPDSSSFAAATLQADGDVMLVDCDHGRAGQRRIRAVLEDLLYIARATLYRAADGAYAIAQDVSATLSDTLDDSADSLGITSVRRPARPSSLSLRYRPSPRDPDDLLHTITRTVTGGSTGDGETRDCPYLRDHEAADRLLCYLALRAQHNLRVSAREYAAERALSERLHVDATALGLNHDLTLQSISRIPGGMEWEAVVYQDAVHTYTPGELPPDAVEGYTPDYSQTPPAAPSALTITAGSTAVSTAGALTARIDVQATVPAVNWSALWFYVEHDSTGEIPALIRGEISGSTASTTLTGLRPGETYRLKCYAVNEFDVLGAVQDTFNATAIGGGASATTFTAPGYATLPGNVSSITALQGSGLWVAVRWTAVSGAALLEYVVERSTGGPYTEVWRGRSTMFSDRDVLYSNTYTYRVKARDSFGNLSASWATSSGVNVAANITGGGGGDIASDTVATSNRGAASSVSGLVGPIGGSNLIAFASLAHSLGKAPLSTIGSAGVAAGSTGVDSSNIGVFAIRVPNITSTEDGSVGNHSHDIDDGSLPISVTVTALIW